MTTKRSHPSPPQPRRLVPWLVKERDLRRNFSRAIAPCKKGRVIFFSHKCDGLKLLVAMFRDQDRATLLPAAFIDFVSGRYRKVVLANISK